MLCSPIVHKDRAYARGDPLRRNSRRLISPADVRNTDSGVHRRQDHSAGDGKGNAQGCACYAMAATFPRKKSCLKNEKEGVKAHETG